MPNLIGTAPDQVPVNGFLGNMAFQNKEGVVTDLLSTTALTVTGAASFAGSIATSLGSAAAPSYTFIGDTNTGIFSPAADTIAFSEGGVEAMRITSAGNVGIGTSAPGALLDVNGVGRFGSLASKISVGLNGDSISMNGDLYIQTSTANPLIFRTNFAEAMRIDSSGQVGIGNSDPGYRLDVSAADTTSGLGYGMRLRGNATANGGSFQFTDSAVTAQWAIITANTSEFRLTADGRPMTFYTNGVEQLRITSTGGITSSDLADAVGYKGLPQNQQTGAYALVLADMGKHIYATAGAFAITVPANATTAFPVGAAITIVVEDAGKTVVPASGVTLVLAGTGAATTGTRTMAIGSVATLIKVGTDRWYISGSGVT